MSKEQVDLLLLNAAQVATCAAPAGARRGQALADVGLVKDGAVAVDGGRIVAVGPTGELRARYVGEKEMDVTGRSIVPGLVDCHTHVLYAGDRVDEFELRVGGATDQEIMAAGGGIVSTMRATRAATLAELAAATLRRLDRMLALGTTTVEIKSGYGLDLASELRMLRATERVAEQHPATIVPTFMGAHALPPEFRERPGAYVDLVIEEMVPAAAAWYRASSFAPLKRPFFCDVFCEENAFDLAQSRRVLEAGRKHGLKLKIHADEFTALGGVALAVELNATSVDHLDVTAPPAMSVLDGVDTVAVLLPAVSFNLGHTTFARARKLIDAGAVIALSTDINPGSAPCYSLPLVMAIAARYQRLLPAETLNAVTINAAHAVGMGDEIGSLEPGKQADLLILDTDDYRHLVYEFGANPVSVVFKAGRALVGGAI